jgi:signal transduction histidine kinase
MVKPDATPDSSRKEALLGWVQQYSPYGVVTLDKSYRIQSWNHWMETHSGKDFKEVAGKDFFELFPEVRGRGLAGYFERALLSESSVLSTALHHYLLHLPATLRIPGVGFMRQTARIAPLISQGEVCGIVLVIEDVTQREIQAEALTRQHRRDQILAWALSHFLKVEEPKKTVRQLFFKIAEHLDFDSFILYLWNDESKSVQLFTAGGIPTELHQQFAAHPLLTSSAHGTELKILEGIKIAPLRPEYELLRQANIAAAVSIPLVVNDKILGLFFFATAIRNAIAKDEAELLTTIGQYLAIALDRENTNQQLQKAKLEQQNYSQNLEKMVEERTSSLTDMISELETFSYTLAHDLKAPVRGMAGYAQVLIEDFSAVLPPAALEIVKKLVRTPRQLEALIKDLLEFSKVSRQEVKLSPLVIEPMLEDILSMRVPAVREVIKIVTPLHPVMAHRALLHQVISNLIDNAIKFVEPNAQASIIISTEVVKVKSPSTRSSPLLFSSEDTSFLKNQSSQTDHAPGWIRISIRDKGIGIPAEAHQKIFGIFERGFNKRIYEGNGMGLAIVARAVQRMKGTCGVESEPGAGSCFWIELLPA